MSTFLLGFALALACGGKKAAPAPAAEAPAAAPATVAVPTPEPVPEPAAPVNNADMMVSIKFADGSLKNGKVVRVERSDDFFGEEGWVDEGRRLVIDGEAGTAASSIAWTSVKSVSVTPGKVPTDVSCIYTTEVSPWMYDCTLTTTGKVVDKEGKSWTVANRHKWRFTFDDDSQVEFWLFKHAARLQDENIVDLDTENPENLRLYGKLQEQLKTEIRGNTFVTAITVQ